MIQRSSITGGCPYRIQHIPAQSDPAGSDAAGNRRLPGLREIRARSTTPVIMLSAKGEVFDKVLGLELGADDYIMKPFDSKEMVARVRAVLRRYQPSRSENAAAEKAKCVEYDGITINLTNYSVVCDGQNVEMPPKELELLYCLASSPNQVFTREQLWTVSGI